jgi:hypothetical protein
MDNEPTLIIDKDGTKRWRLNGKLHRVDGPAVAACDGHKSWWLNGDLHRIDGPAVELANGSKIWGLYDRSYTFDDWLEANNLISEEEKVMLKLQYG